MGGKDSGIAVLNLGNGTAHVGNVIRRPDKPREAQNLGVAT